MTHGRPPCFALYEIPGAEGSHFRKEIPGGTIRKTIPTEAGSFMGLGLDVSSENNLAP